MWLCAYKIPFVLWGSLSVPSVWPAPFDDSRLQIPAFVPVLSCCDFYGRVVWIILHVPFMGSGQLLAVFFSIPAAEPLFPNRLSCHADDRGQDLLVLRQSVPGAVASCQNCFYSEDGRCLDYAMERTVLETCRRYCGVLPEHLPSPMIVHYHKDAEEGAPDDDSTVNTIRTYRGLENGLSYWFRNDIFILRILIVWFITLDLCRILYIWYCTFKLISFVMMLLTWAWYYWIWQWTV